MACGTISSVDPYTVHDRQTDVRRASPLNAPCSRGGGIIMRYRGALYMQHVSTVSACTAGDEGISICQKQLPCSKRTLYFHHPSYDAFSAVIRMVGAFGCTKLSVGMLTMV